jgi:hypothetical protein
MFLTRKPSAKSIDDVFHARIKQYQIDIKRKQLKERVAQACQDTTDYELMLRNFCDRNKNNMLLLVKVRGYRGYLIECGCTPQQAAKETLEEYRH